MCIIEKQITPHGWPLTLSTVHLTKQLKEGLAAALIIDSTFPVILENRTSLAHTCLDHHFLLRHRPRFRSGSLDSTKNPTFYLADKNPLQPTIVAILKSGTLKLIDLGEHRIMNKYLHRSPLSLALTCLLSITAHNNIADCAFFWKSTNTRLLSCRQSIATDESLPINAQQS
jgi:hypothetical protein